MSDAVKQLKQEQGAASKDLQERLDTISNTPQKDVITNVRNRVAAYEDSIRRHHEMVEMAAYKDSVATKLLEESKDIKRILENRN